MRSSYVPPIAKLLLTVAATALLLLDTQPVGFVARAASRASLAAGDLRDVRVQLVADAYAAVLVLLVSTPIRSGAIGTPYAR